MTEKNVKFAMVRIVIVMGLGKWIGGIIGWAAYGPLGALIGIVLGGLLESSSEDESPDRGGYSRVGARGAQGERNSFLLSFLVLSAYIIQADGKIMHSEMNYVRAFLRANFGEGAVSEGEDILKRIFQETKKETGGASAHRQKMRAYARQMCGYMSYEQRLQLLSFLIGLAKADGSFPRVEIDALKEVADALGVNSSDVNSMLHLGGSSLDEAYGVLGVGKDATDDEVRKAYRALALKHHPDKVATLGEDVRKAAEEKLQKINQAKDIVYKARGMR